MKISFLPVVIWASTWLLLLSGCSKFSRDNDAIASTPKEAASHLEQAFAAADAEAKRNAELASEAMRKGEYEKAVVSLQVIRSGENVSLEQGMAIHSSIVTLESQLIMAIEAGDPNAKPAHELLKRIKRN